MRDDPPNFGSNHAFDSGDTGNPPPPHLSAVGPSSCTGGDRHGHLGYHWADGWCSLFLLKLTALCVQQGKQDRAEQLDTAVTASASLYEATTMAVGLMAAWLHVGGIQGRTRRRRAAL